MQRGDVARIRSCANRVPELHRPRPAHRQPGPAAARSHAAGAAVRAEYGVYRTRRGRHGTPRAQRSPSGPRLIIRARARDDRSGPGGPRRPASGPCASPAQIRQPALGSTHLGLGRVVQRGVGHGDKRMALSSATLVRGGVDLPVVERRVVGDLELPFPAARQRDERATPRLPSDFGERDLGRKGAGPACCAGTAPAAGSSRRGPTDRRTPRTTSRTAGRPPVQQRQGDRGARRRAAPQRADHRPGRDAPSRVMFPPTGDGITNDAHGRQPVEARP